MIAVILYDIYIDYEKAVELYSEALTVYPTESTNEIAICYANRGACFIKLVSN